MKKFFTFLIIFFFTIFPTRANAHMLGQPPFLKINGAYTIIYPVPTTSLIDFYLPQDIGASNYLVNSQIEFEIDQNALPIPPELLTKSKFFWEFGDGGKAEGMKVSYIYKKPGTYFAELKVDSGSGFGAPQVLQSTALNILPDNNYKLPKAVIEVNGKQSKDPLLDLIDVNFREKQNFNATKSEQGSSKITKYEWDMGDGTTAEGQELIYSYSENPYTVFPVLRVKTEDGFISDAYLQIKDESAFEGTASDGSKGSINLWVLAGIFGLSVLIAGLTTWLIYVLVLKKRMR